MTNLTTTSPTAPAALDARPVDGLASAGADDWDRLLSPGSGALSHALLQAWEACELPGLRSRPLLAFDTDPSRPVAAVPGYFYDLDILGTRVPAAGRPLDALRKVWPRLMKVKAFELGNPTPLTNPFMVHQSASRPECVRVLVKAAVKEAERGRAQFMLVQNLTSLEGPAASELLPRGFAGVPIFPTAVVDLPYHSFDEYLGSMRAQYRRRARQAFRRSDDLSAERVYDFAGMADELARLWRLIYDRATEVRREVLTSEYFRAVSKVDETSVLLLRRPDRSIASFGLLLDDRPWLSFLQCGFDAEAARSEGAYFRLLYEIVRQGIEGGYEQVDLGVTTLAPKLDVGAVPIPLFALVKHRNQLIQRIVRMAAEGPLSPDEAEPRHVFKEAPPTAAELVARRSLIV